jgi:hypothetical protein
LVTCVGTLDVPRHVVDHLSRLLAAHRRRLGNPAGVACATADGLPTLAGKGYIGASIGIHVPVRRPKGKSEQGLHADTRTTNTLIRDSRALGERAVAELKERWRALKDVSLSPSRIGDIARAPLVLNNIWK